MTFKSQKALVNAIENEQGSDKIKIIGSQVAYPEGTTILLERRRNIETVLLDNVPMTVVQDIVETKKPVDQSLIIWSSAFGLGLVLSIVVVFIRELLRKI